MTLPQSIMPRRTLLIEGLFLLTAFIAAVFFCLLRLKLCDKFVGPEMFGKIADGIGEKPWQYRILIPSVADFFNNLMQLPADESLYAWAKIFEVGFTVLTVAAFRHLLWLLIGDRMTALVLSFSLFLVLPFHFFYPRPYHANYWFDTPGMFFFTLGLILLREKKWAAYYPLFALATLNRETTCFLTVIHLFSALGREQLRVIAAHCGAQFAIWMAIKIVLGKIYLHNPGVQGFEWYDGSGLTHWQDNLLYFANPAKYPAFMSIFGYLWIPILLFRRRIRDPFILRALWVFPPYFAGMFLVANIYELRIFSDLIPLYLAAFLVILTDLIRNPATDALPETGK
jgi:hypothetical protein